MYYKFYHWIPEYVLLFLKYKEVCSSIRTKELCLWWRWILALVTINLIINILMLSGCSFSPLLGMTFSPWTVTHALRNIFQGEFNSNFPRKSPLPSSVFSPNLEICNSALTKICCMNVTSSLSHTSQIIVPEFAYSVSSFYHSEQHSA